MESNETRLKIIEATLSLLRGCNDPQKLTVRQIAEKARVGAGLISYYFGGKDELLCLAIGETMRTLAEQTLQSAEDGDARSRLRAMLLTLYGFAAEYEAFMPYMIDQTVRRGEWGAELTILPLLRSLCPQSDPMRLRITALQIIAPIQLSALAPEAFRLYSGVDLRSEDERGAFIDRLLQIIGGE